MLRTFFTCIWAHFFLQIDFNDFVTTFSVFVLFIVIPHHHELLSGSDSNLRACSHRLHIHILLFGVQSNTFRGIWLCENIFHDAHSSDSRYTRFVQVCIFLALNFRMQRYLASQGGLKSQISHTSLSWAFYCSGSLLCKVILQLSQIWHRVAGI